MKALPDVTVRAEHDVDRIDGAVRSESGTVLEYDDSVIEIYSPTRSEETEEPVCKNEYREHDQDEEDNNYDRRKSKKKHKKHHHKHDDSRIRKKHKKRKNRVDPIFLWAQKKETKIVRVVCEDYDRHNRIRLVRTSSGLWSSNPRSKVLAAAKSRSTSVYDYDEDESQKGTDVDEFELEKRPDNKPKYVGEQNTGLVDLNDNSIDFVEAVCSGEETDKEQRARIDQVLEMIDRDPTLMGDSISLPDVEKTCIKLPEGTTIHQVQVKAEDTTIDNGANTATTTSSVPPPPPSMPLSPVQTPLKFGELTITSQQQQKEPLNLENTTKRCSMEIRLQEPPLKKKRFVQSAETRSQQPQLNRLSPINIPGTVGQSVQVKYETDALSELKEVLSDPTLSVPDPLLVPRARLAALVASPATEIPKLLVQNTPPSLLPLPPTTDPDLLAVSLSHLRSMLQQQPSTNIDQMLWLSYDLSSKDVGGVNDDILSGMLNFLLPPCNSTASQQSFNYPQQKQQQQQLQQQQQQQQQQWNNMYYGGSQPALSYGSTANHGYGKSEDCCSSLSPLQKLLQPIPPISQMQKSHKSRLPLTPTAKQRICREMCCARTSPSPCYESCCAKVAGCNPFAVSPTSFNPFALSPTSCNPFAVSPTGCNPFAMSPTVCAGNLKTVCNTYPITDGAAACCFPQDITCGGYNGLSSSSPISLQRKSSVSPSSRVHYAAANQTGLVQQQQKSPQPAERGGGATSVGNDCAGGGDDRRLMSTADKPQTPPVPSSPIAPPSEAAGVAPATTESVHKPKIKVKKHLVDPNAKPKLLNIEGALHLAGANPQDLFSSPLWHPLFGSQEKRYGCRWQWTTPVTTSESNSPDTSGGNVN